MSKNMMVSKPRYSASLFLPSLEDGVESALRRYFADRAHGELAW